MVVLSVRKAVVEHLETGFLSEVRGPMDRKVSETMAEEKVEKLSLFYCRFCGAYAGTALKLRHRGTCTKPLIQRIDHIPVLKRWCVVCDHTWEWKREGKKCPKCGSSITRRRYL